MTAKEVKEAVEYWQKTAEHDHGTMLVLLKNKEYSNTLFFGHIVLEKILKGLYVKQNEEQAPYTHDLVRLAENISVELDKKDIVFLKDVNDFNIRSRYPERKLAFYKKCNYKFTKDNLEKIEDLYKKLCQELRQKK